MSADCLWRDDPRAYEPGRPVDKSLRVSDVATYLRRHRFNVVAFVALNARGVAAARGGRWQAMTVSNLQSKV
jgi:hypothetical protein